MMCFASRTRSLSTSRNDMRPGLNSDAMQENFTSRLPTADVPIRAICRVNISGTNGPPIRCSRRFSTIGAPSMKTPRSPSHSRAWLNPILRSGRFSFLAPADSIRHARAAAQQALAIDPGLGEARGLLAVVHALYDWDWDLADREFAESIAIAPKSTAHAAMVRLFTRVRDGASPTGGVCCRARSISIHWRRCPPCSWLRPSISSASMRPRSNSASRC